MVAIGAKIYETRPSPAPTRFLGQRIAIHAAARRSFTNLSHGVLDDITQAFGNDDWKRSLPRGTVVCTAIIAEAIPVDMVPHDSFGDYSPGRWAWRLEDVRAIEPPVPARGMQCWRWSWLVPEGVEI